MCQVPNLANYKVLRDNNERYIKTLRFFSSDVPAAEVKFYVILMRRETKTALNLPFNAKTELLVCSVLSTVLN